MPGLPVSSRIRARRGLLAAGLAALALVATAPCSAAGDDLAAAFVAPPASARPWVYWYFMDGMLTREGMTADLEAMRRVGVGGALFLEVNIGLPRGPVEFMSPQWQELLVHSIREADRLGIEFALGTGPGWCGTGGPWVKPEQSMQHLVASRTDLAGPIRFAGQLPQPAPRKPYFGEGSLNAETAAQWREFYRDVAVLAFPTPEGAAATPDIDERALYYREPYSSKEGVKPFLPAPADYPELPAGQAVATDRVVDLTSRLGPDGKLDWDVPAGRWTVLRLGRTVTGQTTRPAPAPGLGLESDKFTAAALDAHFEQFSGKIIAALGPRRHPGAGLTTLHFDSWEMGSQNWSEQFRAEFRTRRGYDPLPYLPAYSGLVVGSPEITARFLWDLRQTASELVVENHGRRLREIARRHGLQLSIEPYDLNPAADLVLGAEADVPMCEFWADGDGFNTSYSCLEATSIAHTHGRPVVGAEAFTANGLSADLPAWSLHPGAMKNQADWALAVGINRLAFHRYQHQPWLDRVPGMTMSGYGTQYERTVTWWEMSGTWHDYLARCQHLLRQGLPVADILYLTPEGAPHVFRPPASAVTGPANLPNRRGYNFDGIDPQTLIDRVAVRDGRLVLPDGMSYRVLVLPGTDTMTPALLGKIRDLKRAGATIIGTRPAKSPSLSGYPQCDAEVKKLADAIWGDTPFVPHSADPFASLYPDYETVAARLDAMGVVTDFETAAPLRYNHRRLPGAEVYFVSNPAPGAVEATCLFRVEGRRPELWDPLTGRTRALDDWQATADGRTRLPLRLEGRQSFFVVFREPANGFGPAAWRGNFASLRTAAEIDGAWSVSFQPGRGAPAAVELPRLQSWTDHGDAGVRYFSGEAVYRRKVRIAPELAAAGRPLYLDLGRVEVMAEVTLNGRRYPVLWCAPYRLDISDAARAGDNDLEIRVVNLWPNRMIGDAHLPPDASRKGGWHKGGVDHWPQWLLDGRPSPTGRITFAATDPFTKDSPLLPSGLLGPVRLQRETD